MPSLGRTPPRIVIGQLCRTHGRCEDRPGNEGARRQLVRSGRRWRRWSRAHERPRQNARHRATRSSARRSSEMLTAGTVTAPRARRAVVRGHESVCPRRSRRRHATCPHRRDNAAPWITATPASCNSRRRMCSDGTVARASTIAKKPPSGGSTCTGESRERLQHLIAARMLPRAHVGDRVLRSGQRDRSRVLDERRRSAARLRGQEHTLDDGCRSADNSPLAIRSWRRSWTGY